MCFLKMLSICWSKILCKHSFLLTVFSLPPIGWYLFTHPCEKDYAAVLPDSELSGINLILNHLEILDLEKISLAMPCISQRGVHRGTKRNSPPSYLPSLGSSDFSVQPLHCQIMKTSSQLSLHVLLLPHYLQ